MINNNLDLTNNIYFKKQITNQKFDKQPLKNTIKNICKDLTHKTNPETSLEKLCTFVENVNSERKNHYTPGNSSRRQLGDPSKLTIDEIFTNGEPSLDTIFNGSIVIGNNTQSDSEYKTFSYTLKNILLYLYENTPEFKTAIDYMNETSRNKMPWKPKYNGIIYNLDNSSRKGAGSISSWKGARGHGYRDSIRTDAQPAEGAPFYMFLSLTKGFSINENFDIETIFHEFAHACQFAAGNAAPFTNTFVNLSSEKSIGAFVNEFETTGSLKGPSPYSEMSFSQSFQPRKMNTKPTYGKDTPQDFITAWKNTDIESYWDYTNSSEPHGISDFAYELNKEKSVNVGQKAIIGLSSGAICLAALSIACLYKRKFRPAAIA